METKRDADEPKAPHYDTEQDGDVIGTVVNASGHVQELDRNFNFISICSVGIVTGNTWAALGGSITVALYNGGPPGVIYELIAVSLFYWLIAASIAELASAIPSSAGVYHWASVTAGPKYGKVVGYFAGWWNTFAWIFGSASMSSILAQELICMWALFHPDYVSQRWHIFICMLIMTCVCNVTILFMNRWLPHLQTIGLVLILVGVFVTILVCAIMPSTTGSGHATTAFVWEEYVDTTGWNKPGLAFVLGMLNGAYSVGTPDCVSHLAEEVPSPSTNIPKAIAAQMVVGLFTAFFYVIALFYSINDLDSVMALPYVFPLGEVYRQATNSNAGALGLMIVIFLPTLCCCIGTQITAGRMLWTLARDGATPFPSWIGRIDKRFKNPFNATLTCGIIIIVLSCIYEGSTTAFAAFVGSFVIFSTMSYLAAIMPHILSARRYIVPGPFWMPSSIAYVVEGLSCAYIIVFVVIYCFPFAMPVSAQNMNYASLIFGGLTIIVAGWWAWIGSRGYKGPQALIEEVHHRAESVTAQSSPVEKIT